MAHIHTDHGQHDHTASAFIIRTDFDEPKLMLHLHKKLGVYLQFGGHIELDENPWQAVCHELLEESGYDMDQLKILQPKERIKKLGYDDVIVHPVPVCHNTHAFDKQRSHFHIDLGYGFVASEPPKHKIGQNESADIRYVSRSELENMPESEMYRNIVTIGLFIFDTCLPKWEQVDTVSFS